MSTQKLLSAPLEYRSMASLSKKPVLTYSRPKDQEERVVPSARALSSWDTTFSAWVVSCRSMCRVYSGSSSWVDRIQNSTSRNRQMKHKKNISCPRMPSPRRALFVRRMNCTASVYRTASGSNL